MLPQKGKIAPLILILLVVVIFGFSLYVFLTTEETVVVINEAVQEPREVSIAGTPPPPPPVESTEPEATKVLILETGVGFLNVRAQATTGSQKLGQVIPGDTYEYTDVEDVQGTNWYRISHPELGAGWVSGLYVREIGQ